MILTITGHRPPKVGGYNVPNPIYEEVIAALDRCLVDLRPETVITGMALGVDQWAAELCANNDIPFIAAIPFEGFDSKWPESSRLRYQLLLNVAKQVVVVSPGTYSSGLLMTRNKWMVDHGDQLLAVWNGEADGGTYNTIRYANRTFKPVNLVQLPPGVWADASNTNQMLEEIKANRLAQQEARIKLDQQRQSAAWFQQQQLNERHKALTSTATSQLFSERAQREKERQERIEAEREEREAVLKAREEARIRERERIAEIKAAAIEAQRIKMELEQLRKEEELKEELRKEKEHAERLKPKRVIDLGE